ncbi:hypothetical protein PBRA_001912 [Plasmodiophora brassicae]|uniref:Peptidase S9 prolyl oligopeptidase catalytic domain-containing protein n=1 Tax=Plasmodiophora brassicae TaxID=37360 RepID=A0A0G4J1Y8_PLABS|nr:hypothetical protein PBRA_001912 [Plasmodiophora brassicae]
MVTSQDSSSMTTEEELLRERKRMMATGVTSFNTGGDAIIVPMPGSLAICRNAAVAPVPWSWSKLAPSGACMDCQLSPDARLLAFIRNNNIWVMQVDTGTETQLTFTSGSVSSGVAEFIMQEEFDRYTGYWWSPNVTNGSVYHILYLEVPSVDLLGMNLLSSSKFVYPHPGEPNAISTVRVMEITVDADGLHHALHPHSPAVQFEYIVRAGWTSTPGQFYLRVLDRSQQHSQLLVYSLHSLASPGRLLFSQDSPTWLTIGNVCNFLKDGSVILAADIGPGFKQLVRLKDDILTPVTTASGQWQVYDDRIWVDEQRHVVWFTANRDTHLERHLYSVSLFGGDIVRHTPLGWTHDPVVFVELNVFVTVSSSTKERHQTWLYDISYDSGRPVSAKRQVVDYPHTTPDARISLGDIAFPELLTFRSRDDVELQAAVFMPRSVAGDSPHPLVVITYGGPGVQLVWNTWGLTVDSKVRSLVEHGFIVAMCDGRGSANRGASFEGSLKYAMGTQEVLDQVDLVRWMVDRFNVDKLRVAITGWSYGGYNSLMCIAQYPDVFKVHTHCKPLTSGPHLTRIGCQICIAGAPVTSWDKYDSGYTERYLGVPGADRTAYATSCVEKYVSHFPDEPDRLVIAHGLLDENVHFVHTAHLLKALITAGKPYILKLFPDERHGLRQPSSTLYYQHFVLEHLLAHL